MGGRGGGWGGGVGARVVSYYVIFVIHHKVYNYSVLPPFFLNKRNYSSFSPECLNKKGAAHHCPSSFWIGRKTINPLSSYIKPQITPPSPLNVAGRHGAIFWRIMVLHMENPPEKPDDWLGGGGGGTLCIWLGLAPFHNSYSFLMISQLTWHLAHILFDCFSLWNSAFF